MVTEVEEAVQHHPDTRCVLLSQIGKEQVSGEYGRGGHVRLGRQYGLAPEPVIAVDIRRVIEALVIEILLEMGGGPKRALQRMACDGSA